MAKKASPKTLRKSITERKEESILARSAMVAGSNAARSSRALGLTVKIIKGAEILTVDPDRTERVVRSIQRSAIDTSTLRKGVILRKK